MSVNWNGRTFGQLSPSEQTQAIVDAFQEVAQEMSDIDYGTWENPTFHVFRADGSEVMPDDKLVDFRGGEAVYLGCKHRRKVQTNLMGCEKYPSVFDLEIRGPEGYVWNAVSDEGRRIQANVLER